MASDLELAVLAYRSYRPSDSNDVTAPSWIETLVRDDPSSGFAASVYTNGDEVVVAFRRTTDWWDGLADAALAEREVGWTPLRGSITAGP